MAKISPELLESEYESYLGIKYFMKNRENNFWNHMNEKFHFDKGFQHKGNDFSAYKYIKNNYTVEIKKQE